MKIKVLSLFSLVVTVFLSLQGQSQETPEYYGADNQEAQFTVQSHTYFVGKPSESTIQSDAKAKAKYMLGFMRRNKPSAALYPKFIVKTVNVALEGSRYRVDYAIHGKGVFAPGLENYSFYIPIMSSQIYEKSQGQCFTADDDLMSSSIFWYHWNPLLPNCPLVEGTDYVKYTTRLVYLENTKSTYPEYERLFESGNLNISSFFGLENYDQQDWNPDTTPDISARDFRNQRDYLVNTAKLSRRVWSESEVRQYYNPSAGKPIPHIEEFTGQTAKGQIIVRLFMGNTGLEHDSKAFHIFLKSALASSQVILYNGHAGIGKNLNLSSIESARGFKMPLSQKYQILFLGSCVPYAYYTDMFFQRKVTSTDPRGSKNLDIIAFGDEAQFGNTSDRNLLIALMQYAYLGSKQSYQQIIPNNSRFYLGVNGDEDNPTSP